MAGDILPRPPLFAGLDAKDKIIVCLIVFFTTIALTLELYWIVHNQEMESRSDILARALSLFWPADRTFRIPGSVVGPSSPSPPAAKIAA